MTIETMAKIIEAEASVLGPQEMVRALICFCGTVAGIILGFILGRISKK